MLIVDGPSYLMVPFQRKITLFTIPKTVFGHFTLKGRKQMKEFWKPPFLNREPGYFILVQGGNPMTPDQVKRKLTTILSADVILQIQKTLSCPYLSLNILTLPSLLPLVFI
jgi:hypothetical protein